MPRQKSDFETPSCSFAASEYFEISTGLKYPDSPDPNVNEHTIITGLEIQFSYNFRLFKLFKRNHGALSGITRRRPLSFPGVSVGIADP
jgi:hypothetical protein